MTSTQSLAGRGNTDTNWREALDSAVTSLRKHDLGEWELHLIARRVDAAIVAASIPLHPVLDRDAVIEEVAKIAEGEALAWYNGEATTTYGSAYQAACNNVAKAVRRLKSSPPSPSAGETEEEAVGCGGIK